MVCLRNIYVNTLHKGDDDDDDDDNNNNNNNNNRSKISTMKIKAASSPLTKLYGITCYKDQVPNVYIIAC